MLTKMASVPPLPLLLLRCFFVLATVPATLASEDLAPCIGGSGSDEDPRAAPLLQMTVNEAPLTKAEDTSLLQSRDAHEADREDGNFEHAGSAVAVRDDEVAEARRRWLGSASPESALQVPPINQWPFSCTEAHKVCFVENELVALEPSGSASNRDSMPRSWANESGASFLDVPDTNPLKWFEQQRLAYNIPGYWDGITGAQLLETATYARAAARSLETADVWNAAMLNITPVVVYTDWPFNFGDIMGRQFFHPYLDWLAKHSQLYGLPLAVALPHGLLLPTFWRLIGNLGLGVESFSVLSENRGDAPLCFNRIIGCAKFAPEGWRSLITTDNGAAWKAFHKAVITQRCPALKAASAASEIAATSSTSQRLVVGFVQRSKGRQILNTEDLLRRCHKAELLSGQQLDCRSVSFSDVLTDVCDLQELDVLIGTHGAQISNSLLMRPGSSLIEVRAFDWYAADTNGVLSNPDAWSSTIAQSLWLTNTTFYWWYGADKNNSFPDNKSSVPGRDSDVILSWPVIACMLERVAVMNSAKYTESDVPLTQNAGCKDPSTS